MYGGSCNSEHFCYLGWGIGALLGNGLDIHISRVPHIDSFVRLNGNRRSSTLLVVSALAPGQALGDMGLRP
jgi:hypothetical protein